MPHRGGIESLLLPSETPPVQTDASPFLDHLIISCLLVIREDDAEKDRNSGVEFS